MDLIEIDVDKEIDRILSCYSTSFWLKDALKSSVQRDCVDALNDAEFLVAILSKRYQKIVDMGAAPKGGA